MTVLPFFRTDEWWVRIFDFPRVQISTVTVLLVATGGIARLHRNTSGRVLFGVLFLILMTQLLQIFPYTPLARKQVVQARQAGAEIRLLVFNVLQDNRNAEGLLRIISEHKPDLVLLAETDPWWLQQLSVLQKSHPYSVAEPLTNTYGMVLYSRFPLLDGQVRYLVEKDVPSIRATVQIPDGLLVYFYGVHPKPPGVTTPQGDRPDSAPRDAELIIIGKEVQTLDGPAIVAGDFNDVAWSHTTRLFQRTSKLLDPRRGRGLFNTFHAKQPLLRFPVDHVFHSEHFGLVAMERLRAIGSDHFPMLASLRLSAEAPGKQEPPPPKPTDPKDAEKTLDAVGK